MNQDQVNKYKLHLEDKLLLLAILLQDAGTFGFLPLNIFQIIIFLMFVVLLFKANVKRQTLSLPVTVVYLFIYIIAITVVNRFDGDSFKSIGYFFLQLTTMVFYLKSSENYSRVKKVIYLAAYILCLYGIFQIIAFYLNIPAIYDLSRYGFAVNGAYVGSNGIFRPRSLYAEPAHLSSIIAGGMFLGLVGNKKESYVKKYKTLIMILFGLLTTSSMVYISMLIFLFVYTVFYHRNLLKKLKYVLFALIALIIIISVKPELYNSLIEKLQTLTTADATYATDLSGFAIISNLRVAFEKMYDGYILGTGFDSHRIYYYDYIYDLYSEVLMYLNVDEAASLFTRILSEFGIVGFFLFIVWLFKKFLRAMRNRNMDLLFFTVLLVVQGLRNGHYIYILATLCFAVCICQKKSIKRKNNMLHTM